MSSLARAARAPAPHHAHWKSMRMAPRRARIYQRAFLPPHATPQRYQELLGKLTSLTDEQLAGWAAANREELTLTFLGWLADEESAASSADAKEQLWALGSKLMALREGLSPVGMDRLQAELRAAALAAVSSSSGDDGDEEEQEGAGPAGRPNIALQARPAGSLSSVVQQTAALGLSPEGLALLQQQAAALEAAVGATRARALTEVIGRKPVAPGEQLPSVAQADEAVRILEVLLSIPDREQRAALLPDAFTPPTSGSSHTAGSLAEDDGEDELLHTTPLRLLQAVDLMAARLEGSSGAAGGSSSSAWGEPPPQLLPGGELGLSSEELPAALAELREDILAYWETVAADSF